MNKQGMLKIQTCVLRVNIHCDGCKHKVKKKLQNIEGVYKVSIDVGQGKVTVSGNVDPATIIKKLEKAGKHAELWGAQKGPISVKNTNQFKNIQIENGGKHQKSGKDQQKGGFQAPQQMHHQSKEVKLLGKDQKSVKFSLPEEDEEDDNFDDLDEDEYNEFDDEFDEGFAAHMAPTKMVTVAGRGGQGREANKATSNGNLKGNKGRKGKKGAGIDVFLKGILGKAGGKISGTVGKSLNRAGNRKEGGKISEKNSGFVAGEGKKGATNGKGAAHNMGGDGGKNNDSWSKKVGEDFYGDPKLGSRGFNEIKGKNKGGGGGRNNAGLTGEMGNFEALQGLPAAGGMSVGHFQGNPYSQNYKAHMMASNQQQRQDGHGAYHPLMYRQPQTAMSYGPPPPPPHPVTDQYTHIFSDENTSSCRIM